MKLRLFALVLALPTLGVFAAAQCAPIVLPQGPIPGLSGPPGVSWRVGSTHAWDPDGQGPAPAQLIIGGRFSMIDGVAFNHIAAFDPTTQTWSPLGSGITGTNYLEVLAMATAPNGDLLVGGLFDRAGGVPVANIARWNGTTWSSVGPGIPINSGRPVYALAAMPNGDIVAGGSFSTSAGSPGNYLLRFDGVSWTQFGAPDFWVYALAIMSNGDLAVGGSFNWIGPSGTGRIAVWNGTTWAGLDTGFPLGTDTVKTLLALPGGELIAGGRLTQVGSSNLGVSQIAKWDGSSWSNMAGGVSVGVPNGPAYVHSLSRTQNGDVIVGGDFQQAGGLPIRNVARWNGTSWSRLGLGLDPCYVETTTVMPSGDIVAGGNVLPSNGPLAAGIGWFNGTTWLPMSQQQGFLGSVYDITLRPNGDAIVAGDFLGGAGKVMRCVARWDGSAWSSITGNLTGIVYEINSVLALPDGQVIVAGYLPGYIARWDGTNWFPLGNSAYNAASKLALMQNGEIVAAGSFNVPGTNVARWNGAVWLPMGLGTNGAVHMLQPLPNGHLAVGGGFTVVDGLPANRFALWDGDSWYVPPASGMNDSPRTSAIMQNGDLVVAGEFTSVGAVAANRIARWNGTTWSPLGTGLNDTVAELLVLPNGDLLAAGTFTIAGGVPARGLARWDGSAWSAFGPVIDDGTIRALALLADGTLAVGGTFTSVGGTASSGYVRLPSGCPASTTSMPTSCIGPSGPIEARVTNLPWTGSTFVSTATGFLPGSLGLMMIGFGTQQLPLSQVHPTGLPGCDVLVTIDASALRFPVAGQASYGITIPNAIAFVGVVLHQQYLQAEFGGQGNLTSLSSSNALTLTVGAY